MAGTRVDRRRRVAKACDTCRLKKLRCDSRRPVCSRCQRLSVSCHYADVAKPDRRSVRHSLNASPEAPTDEAGVSNASSRDGQALSIGTVEHQESSRYHARRTPSVASAHGSPSSTPAASGTVVGSSGDMRFFGPSAWVPPEFSDPRHPKPSRHHAPKQSFPSTGSWSRWTHPSVQSILERRTKQPLPPWSRAFSLVSEFFEQDHKAIPCLHPPTFMTLLGQQYSDTSEESPAWWVALNAVLAIAQRRRVETGRSPPEEENLAWGYAANALASTLDVLMRSSYLLSVQALLAIAWFLIGTPNPQPAFMLIGSALRLAHSIGLHRNDCNSNLDSIEKGMRTKVFWVAVKLDSQLCLQTGRPPAHDLQALHLELPNDDLEDDSEILQATDGSRVNLLRVQAQLALIQDCISRELSSAANSESNSTLTQGSVAELNRQLDEWSASLPPLFQPGATFNNEYHGLVERLHASYYHSVIVANRSHSRRYWISLDRPASSELSASVEASVQRCLIAARAITSISSTIPYSSKDLSWSLLPPNVTAVIALSLNIIRNPGTDSKETDLQAILTVLRLFNAMDEGGNNTYLPYLRIGCQNLFQMAKEASMRHVTVQPRPVQQQDDVSQNHINQKHQDQGIAAETHHAHNIHNSALPQDDPVSMSSQIEWSGALSAFDARQNGAGLGSRSWAGIEQAMPYPVLSEWNLDILLEGNLAPWM